MKNRKASKLLSLLLSLVMVFSMIPAGVWAAETTETEKISYELTDSLSDGDKVLIYNAGSGNAVTSTIKASYYLAGEALTVTDGKIDLTADQVKTCEWTVQANEDDTYTFTQGDKTLAGVQNGTHNNLSLSAGDKTRWTLDSCNEANKSFYVYNPDMTSKYASDGGHIYLEWYAKYTEFSLYDTSRISEGNFGMTFYKLVPDPYAEVPADKNVYELTDELVTGDKVLVHNAGSGNAVTSTVKASYYLEGKAFAPQTVAENKIIAATPQEAATCEWTVQANEDDTYTFTQGDKTLAGVQNGTHNNLSLSAGDKTRWTLDSCNEANKSFYVYNPDMTSKYASDGGHIYLEWYAKYTEFSLYDTSRISEGNFGMTFYKLVRPAAEEPAPATPTASPAPGAVEEGTVVTFSTTTAGATISYMTDGATAWTQGNTYTVNEAVTLKVKATKDGKDSAIATFKYTIKTGEPGEETYGLVTDLDQLTDGSYVVIYNPENKLAMTSDTYRDWYLMAGNATLDNGQVAEPAANQVWKVTVNSDGTYSFTQGDRTVAAWLSGNFVELTNNGSYNSATDNTWKLDVCNAAASTFYMSSGNLTTSYGKAYIEVFGKKVNNVENTLVFCGYSTGAGNLTEEAYGMQFYLVPEPEPEETGDLVTSLSQLTDGATVAIYSPGHKTAISTKPNGDWYLKANAATIENGKVTNFTSDFVWKVKVNADGTYSFYSNDDETKCITVWPSGDYAEVTVNYADYQENGDNHWTLSSAKTEHCFYAKSKTISHETKGDAYIEAYVRNESEVFSGYFTKPDSYQFTENNFALQFYLVDPDDAVEAFDDGEWDGVLTKGGQYVAYNAAAESSLGLLAEANCTMRAIPTTIESGKAKAGNGAYVFTVDTMGRYYSFEVNGKYLATNDREELLFVEKDVDGKLPETAKWFLQAKEGGYIIYNKEATYNGTPVCIEYYSSVFSGWTFSTKNDVGIYLFNFYEVVDGTEIRDGVVQDPSVVFDCEDSRYVEQDYTCLFSLDDLAEEITDITITYTTGNKTSSVTDYNVTSDGRSYSFSIPAAEIDGEAAPEFFTITVNATNSYGISYSGEKEVSIIDEPFFTELTPAPNSQTREDKRPTVSAHVGNVGENPAFTMTVNGKDVEAVFENGVLSYIPTEDMADGRVTVAVTVVRADGVKAEKTWNFTVGIAEYQMYFGQLHSHTSYSDGAGSLEMALEYIASLPKSANVQFVAFTDHSNKFDSVPAANPADALYDQSKMTEASRALWNRYTETIADFNEKNYDVLAIPGFEMTWSGGPGHINTYNTEGLVSRNNDELNNKTGDAGMKLYYQTINKGDSLNQFNHPGSTFGNFTDFSYWDEETDAHMFLVEVGNGDGQIGTDAYYPSYEEYILALDKGWHVAPTNNQDNHRGRWGNANDARDVIMTNDFSVEGIYDAIRALRVYATEDKNLQINYTVNDQPMGTIFSEEESPETLNVMVTLYDPDAIDSITKVELVANGGKVAYTWDNAGELAEGQLTAELNPEYSYYFVRVTQKDGDLAVTAPVWVGKAVNMGITDIKATAEKVYTGEETTLVTTLYNHEEKAATVKSLVYTINGNVVIGTDTEPYAIPADGTVAVNFKNTFTTAKLTTVTVTAVVELDGKEYEFTANVELDVLDRETENEVTDIADVREASKPDDTGYRFVIEGVVTSNASGYDSDTAFFDCIYVQDDTAGICCFPVAGEYKIGDKVRIVGHTDFYQGEPELQVQTIEVIGQGTVEPTEIKASELNDRSAEGKLVTVNGVVDSFEVETGLIQTIMVKDAEGNLARVFIDGYITTGHEVENCIVGAKVSATGLASYDNTFKAPEGPFPRIRIRDRADIICTVEVTLNPGNGEDDIVVELNEDGTLPELPEPAPQDGYIFGGWFDAEEGGTRYGEGDAFNGTALYAHWYELRATFDAELVLPKTLVGTYPTVEDMESAMTAKLESSLPQGKELKDSVFAELVVEYNKEGTWTVLEAEKFPAAGVSVTFAYPDGTTADDDFAVLHLFAEDCNGNKAGDMELPEVTNGDDGITFVVNGTSPVLVGWTTDVSTDPTDPNEPTDPTDPTEPTDPTDPTEPTNPTEPTDSTEPVKPAEPGTNTGDSASPLLWVGLMAFSALGAVFFIVKSRKREKGE